MRTLIRAIKIAAAIIVLAVLHYVLPQHDVARITGTEVIRMDFSPTNRLFFAQADSGNVENTTRDVRLINTVRKKTWFLGFVQREAEGVMVYRNEDTGWIWPPYFKFDSSDLQAEAEDMRSTSAEPKWVVITHYGWRNRFFTIYPNAIAIREASGPDEVVIPWFNIVFFVFLVIAWLFIRAMWRQFRERSVDPLLKNAADRYDRIEDSASATRGRFGRWVDSWRDKRGR